MTRSSDFFRGFSATTLALVAASVVVCLVGCDSGQSSSPAIASPHPIAARVIFAVPFENLTGKDRYDPAATGLSDLISVMLADQKGVTVVERQQLAAIAHEQAINMAGLTAEEYRTTAEKLIRADAVLTGRLYMESDKLLVDAKLIDIPTQRVLASDRMPCRDDEIDDAAMRVAMSLGRQAGIPMEQIDLSQVDMSPLASLHFSKALCCYYSGDMVSAIMQFMQTIDLDPDYIESYYYSALAYMSLQEYGHARIDIEKYLRRQGDPAMREKAQRVLDDATKLDQQKGISKLISAPGESPTTQKVDDSMGDGQSGGEGVE